MRPCASHKGQVLRQAGVGQASPSSVSEVLSQNGMHVVEPATRDSAGRADVMGLWSRSVVENRKRQRRPWFTRLITITERRVRILPCVWEIGSPPWTRFELLRHEPMSARSDASPFLGTAPGRNRYVHPTWPPIVDSPRTTSAMAPTRRVRIRVLRFLY
jgi:hypothetical protein